MLLFRRGYYNRLGARFDTLQGLQAKTLHTRPTAAQKEAQVAAESESFRVF